MEVLLQAHQIYDRNREALFWFLHELTGKDYVEYQAKYAGTLRERASFTSVCGFFELSRVMVGRELLSADPFFGVFNPTLYWERAKPVVQGMRKTRPHSCENFEPLRAGRLAWAARRPSKGRRSVRARAAVSRT